MVSGSDGELKTHIYLSSSKMLYHKDRKNPEIHPQNYWKIMDTGTHIQTKISFLRTFCKF